MQSPETELQRALFASLTADTDLMAEIHNIYDHIPDNPYGDKTAYVSFGPSSVDPEYLVGLEAEEHNFQLDVWSNAVGRTQCKDICHAIARLVVGSSISLETHVLVNTRLVRSRVMDDPDDMVSHGVLQFTFDIEDMSGQGA